MESQNLNLETLGEGGAVEMVNHELHRVLENILDPNTEAKKERKVTLEIKIKSDENRNFCELNYQAKSTLAAVQAQNTNILVDRDQNGKVSASELRPGAAPGQQELPGVGKDNIREMPNKEKG